MSATECEQQQAGWGILEDLPGDPMMWVLILSELVAFGLFLGTFAVARIVNHAAFASGQAVLDSRLAALNTVVLVTSGWAAARGTAAAREERRRSSRHWLFAAMALGAGHMRIVFRHIAPIVLPTLVTIGAIDFATVVLAESSLSFLGLGIQAPEFTWGAMVATGRGYLANAWWIAFWPGLAILLTTLSLNILSNWWRTYADPQQRWRIELARSKKGIPEKRT